MTSWDIKIMVTGILTLISDYRWENVVLTVEENQSSWR
jgi:hypothetical protein